MSNVLCNFQPFIFFTPRKRSLRRLCFYTCLSVILFTGGGRAWRGVCMVGVCMAGGRVHGRGACMPCHYEILQDTVNERAVRILLECILVFYSFTYDSRPYVLSLTSFTMLCYIYCGSYGL